LGPFPSRLKHGLADDLSSDIQDLRLPLPFERAGLVRRVEVLDLHLRHCVLLSRADLPSRSYPRWATRASLLRAAAAREPTDQGTEHQTRLGGEGNLGH